MLWQFYGSCHIISNKNCAWIIRNKKKKLFHLLRGFLWKLFLWFSTRMTNMKIVQRQLNLILAFIQSPSSNFELWYENIQRGKRRRKKITLRNKWKLSATRLVIIYFPIIILRKNFITFSHNFDSFSAYFLLIRELSSITDFSREVLFRTQGCLCLHILKVQWSAW